MLSLYLKDRTTNIYSILRSGFMHSTASLVAGAMNVTGGLGMGTILENFIKTIYATAGGNADGIKLGNLTNSH